MSNLGRFLVAGIFIALTAWFITWFNREMVIDKCLDSGGAWDIVNARCQKD